jgi:hypothetical protein
MEIEGAQTDMLAEAYNKVRRPFGTRLLRLAEILLFVLYSRVVSIAR